MAQRKKQSHTWGLAALALLVVAALSVTFSVTNAQTVNCTYTVPGSIDLSVNPGQSGTVNFNVSATGADCGTDSIKAQLWDTLAQAPWPNWCTPTETTLALNNGSSANVSLTCTPPTDALASTQEPLIRLYRGATFATGTFINSIIFHLRITPVACTGMSLDVNKTSYATNEAVTLSYRCAAPTNGQASSLTVQVVPPNSSTGGTATTLQNVSTGTYTIPGTYFPTAGTYGIRTCINDATCATGTNMVTAQVTSSTGDATSMTFSGTIYKDGQYIDPTTGTTRNCTSPNAWMKEGTLPSGARSFHCMPNFTPNAWDNPPANCAGTLWATTTTSTTDNMSADVCSTTTPTNTGGGTGVNGTTCPSGQTWCPAVGGSSSGCYATCPIYGGTGTSTACALGQTCSSTSWCEGSTSRCYKPNNQITCVAMGQTCASAGGTSCSSTDTNCVEPGGYGSGTGKWCGQSMKCYKKGSTTDEFACTAAMMGPAVSASPTCPTGYGQCSPGSTNCVETGESSTNPNAYCMGQKCNLSTGGITCVGWGETCPSGAKLCGANETNCVEPGSYAPNSSASSKWCAGGSLHLYSSDGTQLYCHARSQAQMMDPNWAPTVPAGYRFCSPISYANQYSSQCLEPGQTGPSGSWCGWMQSSPGGYANTTGSTTRTCPSLPGYTPPTPVPPPTTCSAGQISCSDIAGKAYCYTGTTCPVPVVPPPTCAAGFMRCDIPGDGVAAEVCALPEVCKGTPPVVIPPNPTPWDQLPECKEGEGMGPSYGGMTCRMPNFCWKNGAWEKSPYNSYTPAMPVSGSANGSYSPSGSYAPLPPSTCSSFRVEQLEYMTLWAKRWDPVKFGAWYWPSYSEKTPTSKYNPDSDSMVSCSGKDEYAVMMPYQNGGAPRYHAPCQAMTEDDKPLWLARFRSEYKMFLAYSKRDDGTNVVDDATYHRNNDISPTAVRIFKKGEAYFDELGKSVDPTQESLLGPMGKDNHYHAKQKFCGMAIAYAINPKTNECKYFSNLCGVPEDWKRVPTCPQKICPLMSAVSASPIMCPKGQVAKFKDTPGGCGGFECVPDGIIPPPDPAMCRIALRGYYDEVRGQRLFLRDISRQIAEAPERLKVQLESIREIVKKGEILASNVEQKIRGHIKGGKCSPEDLKSVEEDLRTLREDIMPDVSSQQDAVRVAKECQFFEEGLTGRIRDLRKDAARFDKAKDADSDFPQKLLDAANQFEALQVKAKAACEAVDSFALDDVRFEMSIIEDDLGSIFRDRQTTTADDYIEERIASIRKGIATIRQETAEQNLGGTESCLKAEGYLKEVEKTLDEAESASLEGDRPAASDALAKVDSYRDIVFTAFKQCGVKTTFDFHRDDVDTRDIVRNIAGLDEATVSKIVERVVEKVASRVEVLVNEKVQAMLTAAKELSDKAMQQLMTGVNNLHEVLADKKADLDKLLDIKETIVAEVRSGFDALNAKRIAGVDRPALQKAMETAATVVWCGDLGEQVQQKIGLLNQSLTASDASKEDATSFMDFVTDATAQNAQACYTAGISNFRDPGMSPEQWYFGYFHGGQTVFKGKYSADGKPLGLVEPGRKILWSEGAVALGRGFDVPNVNGTCSIPNVAGASNVPYAACAIDYFSRNNVPLPPHPVNELMTRQELALLVMKLAGDKLPVQGEASNVAPYKDVRFNTEYGRAIATVVANNIMFGKDQDAGRWAPLEVPNRAEVAAVIARLMPLLKLGEEAAK